MSYLFVSHDLNVVRLLCSRIVVMYLGKIVEMAPAEALFTAPRHPYTQALVAAIPDPARRGEARPRLDGSPTQPDRSGPERLPLLRPLSHEHRSLRHGHAAASRRRPGPFRRLPLRSLTNRRKPMSADNEICRMDAAHRRGEGQGQDAVGGRGHRSGAAPHGDARAAYPCLLHADPRCCAHRRRRRRRQDRGRRRPRPARAACRSASRTSSPPRIS